MRPPIFVENAKINKFRDSLSSVIPSLKHKNNDSRNGSVFVAIICQSTTTQSSIITNTMNNLIFVSIFLNLTISFVEVKSLPSQGKPLYNGDSTEHNGGIKSLPGIEICQTTLFDLSGCCSWFSSPIDSSQRESVHFDGDTVKQRQTTSMSVGQVLSLRQTEQRGFSGDGGLRKVFGKTPQVRQPEPLASWFSRNDDDRMDVVMEHRVSGEIVGRILQGIRHCGSERMFDPTIGGCRRIIVNTAHHRLGESFNKRK